MKKDIFKKLAEHLDDLPGGFPLTKSGVELRILRRMFTLEEAELALHLTCPSESMALVRKPQSEQLNVPKDTIRATIQRGRDRGKLSPVKLARMQLKSKIDRLLAAR